jgi:glycosyltransferase involved in cell wall biosynthesis
VRILHVTTRNLPGGSARNLAFHLAWEVEAGAEVHLVVGGVEPSADVPEGVRVRRLPELVRNPSPGADLRAIVALSGLIGALRPDVVHTHQSKAGILARLAARGRVPVVVHTIHMASFGPGYSRATSCAFAAAERHCGRFTDFFVAVGDELRSRYVQARIGRAERYAVIRSPVQAERFLDTRSLTPSERACLRHRLGLGAETPVLVAAGLLERRKRFDLAIRQLSSLLSRTSAVLVVAGAGPEEAGLRDLAARAGVGASVRFTGFVENLPEYLAVSDLLVHTSLTEGVPQVVVQSLAAGLPVLATETVGLREVMAPPVTVIPAAGCQLGPTAERLLSSSRPAPVPALRVRPWTDEAVRQATARFHEHLCAAVSARGCAAG